MSAHHSLKTPARQTAPASEDLYGRKSLRRLLRAWHDPAALRAHPLARGQLVTQRLVTHHQEEAATALRAVVRDAIEALRPAGAPPSPPDRRWRAYVALIRHYLEDKPLAEVARELCVEAVSCRRALQQALDALGAQLQQAETRALMEATAAPAAPAGLLLGRINTAPAVSGPFIGRRALLEQAKSLLAFGCRRLALHGLPGSGKSTALAHLARSSFAQAQFADGVLWAYLGPQPDVPAILSEWGLALGLSQHDLDQLNAARRAQTLRHLLSSRRVLFAFNDVWQLEHIAPLLIGNEHCAYILSTCSAELAASFADAHACLRVDELSLEESLRLLNTLAPGLETDWREALVDVAQACGGLPLTLTLIGHYLRRESHAGQPRRIRAAFARLRERSARLTLRPALNEPNGLSAGARSLGETIALSVSLLRAEDRRALASLCALPPKPAGFDEEVAVAILRAAIGNQASPTILDRLVDAGLIESQADIYSIHPAIADWHTANTSPDADAVRNAGRRALIDHMIRRLHSADQCSLPAPEWSAALAAMQAAIDLNEPDAAAHFAITLFDCLDRRGLRPLAEQLLDIAEAHPAVNDPARRCQLDILRGQALIWHGELQAAIQRLSQAAACAQQARPDILPAALNALAQAHLQAGNAQQALDTCDQFPALSEADKVSRLRLTALTRRAAALACLGRYDEAEATTLETITLARALQNPAAETTATINLGILCRQRNRPAEAVQHLEAGLALARQIDFREQIALALTALGVIAVDAADYAQAERYYQEALALARPLDSRPGITLLEHALGVLALRQEQPDVARGHLEEALMLAEQHGMSWYRASVRVELGELHLARGDLTRATETFAEGLRIAEQHSYADLAALNQFGLARVRATQGDLSTARALAASSLDALRARQHYRADEVAHWIEALPQ